MSAKCPVCSRSLSAFDWRQTCPKCGTNLMFHGFEERFFNDAKMAELGFAKVRVWWAKVLSCYFGGKLQIIRLCFILLPVLALLIPFAKLNVNIPLYNASINFNLIGIINAFSNGAFNLFLQNGSSPVSGDILSAGGNILIALAGALLCGAAIIIVQLLCFLGKKATGIIISIFGFLGIGFSVFAIFTANSLKTACDVFSESFSSRVGFGQYVLIIAFICVIVPNILLTKKGITINYKEGDLYRLEIAKKLKSGEIKLDDLPQPIFETEAEKAEREKAIDDTMHGKAHEGSQKED